MFKYILFENVTLKLENMSRGYKINSFLYSGLVNKMETMNLEMNI